MFKSIMIVSFFVAVLTMVHTAPSEYGSKFDNVNLDDILNNDRLFNNYFKCLMETGKCTPEGEELKRVLPEVMENKCAKCTDKQKEEGKKVFNFLNTNKKEQLKQLVEKYDPEGIYRKRFEEEAKELKIQV